MNLTFFRIPPFPSLLTKSSCIDLGPQGHLDIYTVVKLTFLLVYDEKEKCV